ncbi:MAG: hypothetical protein K8R90_09875 [Candidatus Cloacimonetes bacterium]|nr:hypothetical protein [Candidatus Cloacimonadota bacterium]
MKLLQLACIMCLLISSVALTAQEDNDLDATLRDLSESAGRSYVAPIVNAFGADFNSGWFTRAPRAKILGIEVAFKFVMMGAVFNESDNHFNTTGSFRFTDTQADTILAHVDLSSYTGANVAATEALRAALKEQLLAQSFDVGISGPTIVGPDDEFILLHLYEEVFEIVTDYGEYTVDIDPMTIDTGVSGMLDEMPSLPLFAPQFTLGTIQGTNLTVRFWPKMDFEDLGEFTYWGIGVQHNPTVWLNPLLKIIIPLDLCVQFSTQRMELGSIVAASSWNFGANASKSFGLKFLSISPYAGLMVEGAKLEFDYEYEYSETDADTGVSHSTTDKISFDLESENQTRLVLGVAARLGVLDISYDFNISQTNSYSLGIGLGFTF